MCESSKEELEVAVETKMISRVTKRSPVDIEFSHLTYSLGKKQILKSINGKFKSGHLTGILGSSGAGKTSLLNILSGHIHNGVEGQIIINGRPRQLKKFHKISRYIMQDDILQPLLSVREAMAVATKLKFGADFTSVETVAAMQEVVALMGLEECLDTRMENLSGGQRKRLSIALELVNNPPVLFLDEPTTGLDNVTMKNCIDLLKFLTSQGRTIICTIHQPSDSAFQLFDQVYFMSDGWCIYNGKPNAIVPFLSGLGLPCPTTYSPADYIIELVHFGEENTKFLKEEIDNGKCIYGSNQTIAVERHSSKGGLEAKCSPSDDFPVSFWTQFWILSVRMFLQMSRNKQMLALQFGHHVLCGVGIGVMFYGIGNEASLLHVNMKLLFGFVIFFLFTHLMSPVLLFPFEVRLLQREYFNRWYSLKAYYLALTLTILPVMIITSIVFIGISYTMTNQPMDTYRICWFTLICLITALASQGLGYAVGSLFTPTSGAIVGSALALPMVVLAMYGIGHGNEIDPAMDFVKSLSFPNQAFVGLTTLILGNRSRMSCEESFCYFGDPQIMLRILGMEDRSWHTSAISLTVFMVLHRFITYFCLRIRVTPDSSFGLYKYFHRLKT